MVGRRGTRGNDLLLLLHQSHHGDRRRCEREPGAHDQYELRRRRDRLFRARLPADLSAGECAGNHPVRFLGRFRRGYLSGRRLLFPLWSGCLMAGFLSRSNGGRRHAVQRRNRCLLGGYQRFGFQFGAFLHSRDCVERRRWRGQRHFLQARLAGGSRRPSGSGQRSPGHFDGRVLSRRLRHRLSGRNDQWHLRHIGIRAPHGRSCRAAESLPG